MMTIRKFVYAALLAVTSLNFAPSLASAQEAAHGKFTLTHDVHWGYATLPAGEYEFSFDPNGTSRMLALNKLSAPRTGFLLPVFDLEDAKSSDTSVLRLESTPAGSYVSEMLLPQFGMAVHFAAPPHSTERQVATAVTAATAAVQ